jgi:hypothetical protein
MPHYGGGNTAADEFTRDATTISQGIVVNDALAPSVINANKQAFANEFVTRVEFRSIYDGLSNTAIRRQVVPDDGRNAECFRSAGAD